jgi:acyl-coenzyme A synthetase/AMP-(fatty) acid ligase
MITNRIYEWARAHPTKTAMIHNDRLYSYAVFARAIEATKNFFDNQNLLAGRTAIVLINNLADAWIVVLGLRSIGLDTICVSSLKVAKALNVRDVICIVLTEAEEAIHNLEGPIWADTAIIAVPRAIYANINTGDIPRPANGTPPFGGHILYTSGTTGSYRKILEDGSVEEQRNVFWANCESFDSNTVHFLANFAPWTITGFVRPSAIWHAGGCVVFDQFPGVSLRFLRHGVTHAVFVTPMLNSLLELRDVSTDLIAAFQLHIVGGFLPLALAERAVERLTKNVTVIYGATEHTSRMRSRFRTKEDLHWLSPDIDSGFEIADENGNECSMGEEGQLRVLLRDIDATSYLDDEEASGNFFRDGYFYSGDMAVRRADGRIRVLGRVADVLNLQGQKIAAAPVEQKIQEFLGVNAVCLFSLLSDDGKEELVVAIEATKVPPKPKLDKISHEFKSFERVRFEVLREFPRAEAGMQKIKRTELRKVIASKGARTGGAPM